MVAGSPLVRKAIDLIHEDNVKDAKQDILRILGQKVGVYKLFFLSWIHCD